MPVKPVKIVSGRSRSSRDTISVPVRDPLAGTIFKAIIYEIMPCKEGLLGRMVNSGYNVFRPWSSQVWLTNVTSSTRFNIETDGMTPEEMSLYMEEHKAS